MMSVVYESSDLAHLRGAATQTSPSDSIRPGVSASNAASATGSTSPAAGQPASHGSHQSRLSTGAQAGIGVGAALAGILILLLAVWLLRRKRRRSKPGEADNFWKPELHSNDEERTMPHISEKDNTNINEVDEVSRPSEMGHGNLRAELEGDWYGHEAATG